MSDWKEISGGVTAPGIGQQELLQAETFRTPDLALILSDVEASQLVCSRQVRAAPVDYCRQRPQAAQVPVLSSAMLGKQTQQRCQGWLDALESACCLGKR